MSNDEQKITQNVIQRQINLCDYLSEQTNDYNLTDSSEALRLQNINIKPNIHKEVRKKKHKKQNRLENSKHPDKGPSIREGLREQDEDVTFRVSIRKRVFRKLHFDVCVFCGYVVR